MTEPQSSWAFVGISPEARQAAELAAEAAGMELDTWLAQLIKYKSTMELKGREAVPLDTAIMQIAAPGNGAAATAEPRAPEPIPESTPEPEPEARAEPEAEPRVGTDVEFQAEPAAETATARADAAEEPDADEDKTLVTSPPPKAEDDDTATPDAASEPAVAAADAAPAASPPSEPAKSELAKSEPANGGPAEPQPAKTELAEVPPAGVHLAEVPSAAPEPPRPVPAAAIPEPAPPAKPAEPDQPAEVSPRRNMPTEALRPSRLSALNQASEEAIQGAFDAWRDSRTLEPLLVRPSPDERNVFEVIVGVERWHAARRAHIRELPVLIHEASDEEAIRLAMSARLKRGPLSPLTEAGIYLSLMSEASMSTEQVARMVGKPPAHVATMVRVLSLPRSVRDMLERGELTALHARALLDAPNAEGLAREVIAKRLDIYQTEQLVRTATIKAERAEKVDLDAVDLDLGESERERVAGAGYAAVAGDATAFDGDVGFGPETRFDRESFATSIAAVTGSSTGPAEEAPPFDEADADLVFDDVPEDALDLIETPEINEVEVTIAAPVEAPPANEAAPAEPPAPKPEPTARPEPKATPEPAAKAPPQAKKGVVTTELLEHHLSHLLGLKVSISESHNMGVISIHYTSREELSDVVSRLNSGSPG